MICPWCEFDNIPGVDTCESCGHDLTAFDRSRGGADLEGSVARTPVSHVEGPPMIIVEPTATVGDVVHRLIRGNVGCALVVSNDKLIGIFGERDLLMKVGERYEHVKLRPVRDFMTPNPETLGPDATVAFALNRMDVGGFRHIPIVRDGRPEAVLCVRDLLRYLSDHYPRTAGQPV